MHPCSVWLFSLQLPRHVNMLVHCAVFLLSFMNHKVQFKLYVLSTENRQQAIILVQIQNVFFKSLCCLEKLCCVYIFWSIQGLQGLHVCMLGGMNFPELMRIRLFAIAWTVEWFQTSRVPLWLLLQVLYTGYGVLWLTCWVHWSQQPLIFRFQSDACHFRRTLSGLTDSACSVFDTAGIITHCARSDMACLWVTLTSLTKDHINKSSLLES